MDLHGETIIYQATFLDRTTNTNRIPEYLTYDRHFKQYRTVTVHKFFDVSNRSKPYSFISTNCSYDNLRATIQKAIKPYRNGLLNKKTSNTQVPNCIHLNTLTKHKHIQIECMYLQLFKTYYDGQLYCCRRSRYTKEINNKADRFLKNDL